jgi:hypothetical protein
MSKLFDDTIYYNSSDNKYRYALGTKGNKTLYCFGINPSTATPEKYDPTITRIKNVAYKNGFDSFIMLNIYPLRATNPDDLTEEADWSEHNKNMEIILDLIKDSSTVWAAWGDLIYSRKWIVCCLDAIFSLVSMYKKDIHWVKMGELTKSGNPRHPLYLKYQKFSEYDHVRISNGQK